MPLLSASWIPLLLWGSPTLCLPDNPLVATELYEQLRPYSVNVDNHRLDNAPSGTLGACSIDKGVVRTASGVVVAEAFCGLNVKTRGIVDSLGLQVGASGQDVLDAYGTAAANIACFPDGDSRTRCWFDDSEDAWQSFSYVVIGEPAPTEDWGVRGATARRFFAARTVIELQMRGGCH